MKYKLVAFDLDGTLIGKDVTLHERVRAAIARMRDAGISGCIVTGRMYGSALPFARTLEFTMPIVCYQGAAIVDPQRDEVLRDIPVKNAIVREVLRYAKADGKHVQLYRNDRYYSEQRNRFTELYAKVSGVEPVIVPSLETAFEESDSTKVVVMADETEAQAYMEHLRSQLGERAYVTRSLPEFIEIMDPHVDKGDALRFLAESKGITCEEIAAIGDSWNDEPLLHVAGFGIAMGSAPSELRVVADAVVADVEHDGVAEAIERYILA